MMLSSSESIWDSVSPKAWAILSRDASDGSIFFRYHDDMVDWGISERLASSYSVQPRSLR